MDYVTIILILIIIGLVIWIFWLLKRKGGGLAEYNEKMRGKKEEAKEKIMGLFDKKEKIDHGDVVSALNVSKNSAIRYLDELEADGKIKQVGKTGQAVFYTKI